jgi:methyl acetate hydrolase
MWILHQTSYIVMHATTSGPEEATVLEQILDKAVETQNLPFAVGRVVSKGEVLWAGAAGSAAPGLVASQETQFRLWSMTKGIGALAVMVLVDRGELSLDTEVADVLPAFDELEVIESIDGSSIQYRRPARRATIRHLLTHTSGLAYPLYNPKMIQYMQATGMSYVMQGRIDELTMPLMFDPGTEWSYGIGPDWAGYVIQQVTGRSVEDFCQTEIFEPLALPSFSFRPSHHADHLAGTFARTDQGTFVDAEFSPPADPELHGLGNALYGNAQDYTRFLQLVLGSGELDGVRLISPETFRAMTSNQIGDVPIPAIRSQDASISADVDHLFDDTRMTHTAGFFRTEADVPGMRSEGSLWWAGFLNTHYWVDPARDIAAVLMTQSLPFCEARFMGVFADFEREVYRAFR